MAAVAVATPLISASAESWQNEDPSLMNLRLSLLDRGRSDGVMRRKRTGSSRHSWRWSWKQMLTKPFQYQTWSRGRNLRQKRKKREKHEKENDSKNPVEARKKMDELYRIWLLEVEESSESSDDEHSQRDRRWSSGVFVSDSSSSSDDDTESDEAEEEHQVSQYVTHGPTRIMMDNSPEDEGIKLDFVKTLETNSDARNLLLTPKQENVHQKVDHKNTDAESNCSYPTTSSQSLIAKSEEKKEILVKETVVAEPNSTNTDAKSLQGDTMRNSWNCEENENTVAVITDNRKIAANSEVSHDFRILSKTGQGQCDPEAMTTHPGMINITRNEVVISGTQIVYARDILKRVDELCTQCIEVYDGNEIRSFERKTSVYQNIHNGKDITISEKIKSSERGHIDQDNSQALAQNDEEINTSKWMSSCGKIKAYETNHGESPQVISPKGMIDQIRDVEPDYPSSYSKTGAQQQMTSQHENAQDDKTECEFKRFGCQFQGCTSTAVQLEQHMQSSLNEHLKLVSNVAQNQKQQLESQHAEQQKHKLLIQQLMDTVNSLEDLVKEQREVSQSHENNLQHLKDQMKDQRKHNQRFERELTNEIQVLREAPIRASGPCMAEFVWPIRNVSRKLRRVQEGEMDDPLISEPFYTGTYGYKLSLWVYLNGRGKTLGDWVSVYARVMPSDHDKILSWPVRPTYTFTLLDQSEGEKEHVTRTRKVNDIKRESGKHHGIHRPEGGERSVIVGFDDFITHAQLEKRKYVVDDCMYIKLEANITY